jgi:hypothetical protein
MKIFALVSLALASPISDWAGKLVPNQYIIVFKPDIHISASEDRSLTPSRKALGMAFHCSSSCYSIIFLV